MRLATAALMLVGLLAGSPATQLAPPAGQTRVSAKASLPVTPAAAATHAVRGVVKTLGAKSLVITRPSRTPTDLTFVLTPATLRGGVIAAGALVSVRYRTEGQTRVATAVIVDPARDTP